MTNESGVLVCEWSFYRVVTGPQATLKMEQWHEKDAMGKKVWLPLSDSLPIELSDLFWRIYTYGKIEKGKNQ